MSEGRRAKRGTGGGVKGVASPAASSRAVAGRAQVGDAQTRSASIAAVIAEQLPGWHLAPPAQRVDSVMDSNEECRQAENGASLADLARKFLGQADAIDAADAAGPQLEPNVQVVRIEPVGGGAARTAEIREGKLTVVSG